MGRVVPVSCSHGRRPQTIVFELHAKENRFLSPVRVSG